MNLKPAATLLWCESLKHHQMCVQLRDENFFNFFYFFVSVISTRLKALVIFKLSKTCPESLKPPSRRHQALQ